MWKKCFTKYFNYNFQTRKNSNLNNYVGNVSEDVDFFQIYYIGEFPIEL